MPLAFLDLTLATLDENLALDEALLLEADEGRGGELLRLWHWPTPAVVLGAGGSVAIDVNEAACRADGVPLGRRSSGGGTVLLGEGCLLYSLVLRMGRQPGMRDIRGSYRLILGRTGRAFEQLLPGVVTEGSSDLAAAGVKFSGNAQQRKSEYLLHHGTLLCGFDLALVARYLNPPEREPDYRAGRPHAEFVRNLPADPGRVGGLLREAWGATGPPPAVPAEAVRRLVAEKYGTEGWVRRR